MSRKRFGRLFPCLLLITAGMAMILAPSVVGGKALDVLVVQDTQWLVGGSCGHTCRVCKNYAGTCEAIGVTDCDEVGDLCRDVYLGCTNCGNWAIGSGTVDDKCGTGTLGGRCGGYGEHTCLDDGNSCSCQTDPPNWTCGAGSTTSIDFSYYEDPC
jgi:hypothetical protein